MAPPPAQTRRRIASASLLLMACACCIPVDAVPRNTTIYNNRPRYDMRGQFVDAHDGMILAHTFPNGSTFYFLYGEFYNLTSGGAYPSSWGRYPQLSVYTSDDMSSWSYRGQAVSDGRLSSSSKWIPNVFYDAQRGRFVLWYVPPTPSLFPQSIFVTSRAGMAAASGAWPHRRTGWSSPIPRCSTVVTARRIAPTVRAAASGLSKSR
jgi:hypothetical protein